MSRGCRVSWYRSRRIWRRPLSQPRRDDRAARHVPPATDITAAADRTPPAGEKMPRQGAPSEEALTGSTTCYDCEVLYYYAHYP